MATRDIFLKIEAIVGYSPVEPDDHVSPPIQYRRDCMRNPGHEDGTIPDDEVNARRLTALIYREYIDANYLVPKPEKLVAADINEPAFTRRVPGTVIYASPGDWLHIHVKNGDTAPHSFHLHGLRYGIDSDGSWPFGTQSNDGRRSDEICPGQKWTYTFHIQDDSIGAWPFHDHYRNIDADLNRGLFGGLVVLPESDYKQLPCFQLPPEFEKRVRQVLIELERKSNAPGKLNFRVDPNDIPEELAPFLSILDEVAHAPQPHPPAEHQLYVPLFFHEMNGPRTTPVFGSAPLNPSGSYVSPIFTVPGTYNYICGIRGAIMSGSVTVKPGAPATETVSISDFAFDPANVIVGIGGKVTWRNFGAGQHSIVEQGGKSLSSLCLNGRSFVGNTPTIIAHAGQRIRWYVFDLDVGTKWHNFHPHAQRWEFAGENIDVRSIGPGESFVADTKAPSVLQLPQEMQHCYEPHENSKEYCLRGDFPVHCHSVADMARGMVAIVRSHETLHLTPREAAALGAAVGLPIDPGDNACPSVADRCKNAEVGQWEELPNLPGKVFMHAVLLPNTSRILFWGYDNPTNVDQTRLWDQTTGLYTQPVNQPQKIAADENIWSGAQAQLNDNAGTILIHGGFHYNADPPRTPDTERRAFLFDPVTSNFVAAANVNKGRFYPTTLTLSDGRPMTLFGQDNASAGAPTAASLEIFTPGGPGSWSAPKPIPFNYFYYPWAFLLPGGDVFIAGPQKPARRFNPAATPIVDDPSRQFNQIAVPQRGVNMDGTALLLPLRPPNYEPRVLVAGGTSRGANWVSTEEGALQTAEWINLSAAAPVWQSLPNMNVARDKVNSVLLPNGEVIILGGVELPPDGGPIEIFDPENPGLGFQLGPNMAHGRGYHSAAILLPDGSVIMGGDPNGGTTPNERYRPPYFFRARPQLLTAPATIAYGAGFSVETTVPGAISEVVLMRPGAVTHGFNQNQRYVGCVITGASGSNVQVTAPPNGTIAPPGYYLLFILDRDRVPSMGRWIRLTT